MRHNCFHYNIDNLNLVDMILRSKIVYYLVNLLLLHCYIYQFKSFIFSVSLPLYMSPNSISVTVKLLQTVELHCVRL
jgi:hypothetical protein